MASRFAMRFGEVITIERERRGWSTRDLARRARVAPATVSNVAAGRPASLDVYARLAEALALDLSIGAAGDRRRPPSRSSDPVHSAMGEIEVAWLSLQGYQVSVDHPYQHYQFAGRADVLAWTLAPPALLHIENRTQFPDIQAAAGSYNAKRRYLAGRLADELGIGAFRSETHVIAALWSSEVLHRVRLRRATFKALCPDGPDRFRAWLVGQPPPEARSSSLVLLDPLASSRQAPWVGLGRALDGVRPRVRSYRDAARELARGRRRQP